MRYKIWYKLNYISYYCILILGCVKNSELFSLKLTIELIISIDYLAVDDLLVHG